MFSQAFSLLLSGALLAFIIHPLCAQSSQADNLRRKVIAWGTNKPIAIKLKSGEMLKGRIADIKSDALSVQLLEQSRIVTRDLRWDDLNKFSLDTRDQKARKVGGWIAAGVLTTVLIVIVVALNDPNF
ncbi:MAG TPA: hypothetical protein VFZ34_06470 [Blastocatellia bacterium]|nr:hypothetical protein [Blastocatellia bacterium]